jgi:hypothetical protein
MNSLIYFRKVDVNKNSFLNIEEGFGEKVRKSESERNYFGMNLHVGFCGENFFWMRSCFPKHLHQLF